jgi:hypothetical protein
VISVMTGRANHVAVHVAGIYMVNERTCVPLNGHYKSYMCIFPRNASSLVMNANENIKNADAVYRGPSYHVTKPKNYLQKQGSSLSSLEEEEEDAGQASASKNSVASLVQSSGTRDVGLAWFAGLVGRGGCRRHRDLGGHVTTTVSPCGHGTVTSRRRDDGAVAGRWHGNVRAREWVRVVRAHSGNGDRRVSRGVVRAFGRADRDGGSLAHSGDERSVVVPAGCLGKRCGSSDKDSRGLHVRRGVCGGGSSRSSSG